MFERKFGGHIYVQLYKDKIVARLIETRETNKYLVQKSFHHPRMLIGDFQVAESELTKAVAPLLGKGFIKRTPIFIMHQREILEGGLTKIEIKVLTVLGLGAKAREAHIWQSHELSDQEILNQTYKNC